MRVPAPLLLLALWLSCLVSPQAARATTLVPLSVDDLTWVSDVIVEAQVQRRSVESVGGYLHTLSELQVLDVVKGEVGGTVVVRSLGGVRGTERTTVPSTPTFTPGERVLLFLERDPLSSQTWRVVGMVQGKYTLITEPDTGRDVLVKVNAPWGTPHFDELKVPLPAVRRYADDLVGQLRDEIELGYVPPFWVIPGMPLSKAWAFLAAARAAGQAIDAGWLDVLHTLDEVRR